MKTLRALALVLPLALVAACGGAGPSSSAPGASSPPVAADLLAAAPSMQLFELTSSPLDVAPTTAMPPPSPMPPGDACHPHLLLRGEETVARVNRHLYKVLFHVEDAIASDRQPLSTGDTVTFHKSRHGIDAELTVKRDTDTTYSWLVLLKKTADSTYTRVASGDLDRTGAAGPHQGKGHLSLDLGKVAAVTGDDVAGTIAAAFESFPARRLVSVHAVDVVWDTDSRHGFAHVPRSADYVSLREPGKGGSLKISEEAALACPLAVAVKEAHIALVHRWYLPTTGGVHGRADAALTGGLLDALKIAVIEALTCHSSASPMMAPAEGAWLLKAEDAAGKTLWGAARFVGVTPCDPLLNPPLGDVPSLADNKTDFDFSGIDFTDDKPYPFPGM